MQKEVCLPQSAHMDKDIPRIFSESDHDYSNPPYAYILFLFPVKSQTYDVSYIPMRDPMFLTVILIF